MKKNLLKKRRIAQTLVIVCLFYCPLFSQAEIIPPAYHTIAREYGIPVRVLYAIALTESGFTKAGVYHPWPWTLNIAGNAARFDTEPEAAHALHQAMVQGQTVDVGLMQINVRWHQQRVKQPGDLLDPWISLQTAAHILLQQKTNTRDWWETVGRYHAPGNDKDSRERANRYRQRVHHHYLRSEHHE